MRRVAACDPSHRLIVVAAVRDYRRSVMLTSRSNWLSRIVRTLRELGPYAAVGLIVPGGSLLLLGWWASRNRHWLRKIWAR